MLPPESRRIGASGPGQRTSIGRDALPGPLPDRAERAGSRRAGRRVARVLQDEVLGDRQRADDALAVPVLRNAPDAARRPCAAGSAAAARSPARVSGAGAAPRVPATSAGQRALAVADTPAMPTISPRMHRRATPRRSPSRPRARPHAHASSTSSGVARRRAARGGFASTSRPTIRSASVRAVGARGRPVRDLAPGAQHRDAVGRAPAPRPSLWRMKMIDEAARRRACAASRTGPRPPAASARRSARRGSACARRGRAPSGSRPAASRRPRAATRGASGVDVEAGSRRMSRSSFSRAARSRRAERPAAARCRARCSRAGQVLGQREVLVHHADAGRERRLRRARRERAEARRRARAPAIVALIGDVVAEQDVHQRRLAGAVLAEQRQDLAAARGRGRSPSLATSAPKRLVMPRRAARTGAGGVRIGATGQTGAARSATASTSARRR